jgi:hypothetical protein
MNDIKEFQLPAYPSETLDEQVGAYFLSDLTSPPIPTEFAIPDFSAHALPTAPHAAGPAPTAASPDESEFDTAILAASEANPLVARELEFLRTQTFDNFMSAVNTISISLPREQGATPSRPLADGPMDVRALRAALGGGASAGRQHKELAEQLAIGALANLDNPAWNPQEPGSGMAVDQNSLFTFLRS